MNDKVKERDRERTKETESNKASKWMSRRASILMKDGERRQAERTIQETRRRLRNEGHEDPVAFTVDAREAAMPSVETVSVKRGGASYQVPHPLHQNRRESLAVRWTREGSRLRVKKGKTMAQSLARELLAIGQDVQNASSTSSTSSTMGMGAEKAKALSSYARNKKQTRHRTAKSNRVFAHLRWR